MSVKRLVVYVRRSRLFSLEHILVCALAAIIICLLTIVSVNLSFFNPIQRALDDFSMTDVYFEVMRNERPKQLSDDIVLVDMTKLHDRLDIAETIADINRCAPKVMVIDLIFQGESGNPMSDTELVNAINRCKNVVISSKLVDYREESESFSNQIVSFFAPVSDCIWGYGNVVQNYTGGCIRKYSLAMKLDSATVFSMPYWASCLYMDTRPKADATNERVIVYDNTDFLVIDAHDVSRYGQFLKGKMVFLGTLSKEEDVHITPVGKMPGMKVQAYSAQSFLKHPNVKSMGVGASLILTFLLCYLSAWIGYLIIHHFRRTYLYALQVFYFCLAALLVWGAFLCFVDLDYNVRLFYPLLGMAMVEEGRFFYTWIVETLASRTKWKFVRKSIYL